MGARRFLDQGASEVIVVDGRPVAVRRTSDFGHGDEQGWYLASQCHKYELRRDGMWHFGFDQSGKESKPWPTESAARAFAEQAAQENRT
jgi:hypothetical protein